jgi:glyoxylase-like metal-dependent hydrolase (beta-lactamase superfamily II)
MQQIEQDIYISNVYPGVTLGALALPYGILMVDSPPHPDDGRSWHAILRSLGSGVGRLLVNLDSHPDRTLGVRLLDCPVIAHQETALEIDKRPTIFKGQSMDTGAEWENCDGLSGLRWTKPTLAFTERATLEWGEYTIRLQYCPGPDPGAIWLIVPEVSVVFVGDAVLVNQPPFFKWADLPAWIETLDLLLSKEYRNFLVVSGRGGVVNTQIIREQRSYLKEIQKRFERLFSRNAPPETTEGLVSSLLSRIDFSPDRQEQYVQRLKYGLFHYYRKHYYPEEEENPVV